MIVVPRVLRLAVSTDAIDNRTQLTENGQEGNVVVDGGGDVDDDWWKGNWNQSKLFDRYIDTQSRVHKTFAIDQHQSIMFRRLFFLSLVGWQLKYLGASAQEEITWTGGQ